MAFMKKSLAALLALSQLALAQDDVYTIDLDVQEALEDLEQNGFELPADGTSVQFSVYGNPTTGYDWVIDESTWEGAFTAEVEYVVDDEEMDGSGGTYYFTVQAVVDGTDSGLFKVDLKDWSE